LYVQHLVFVTPLLLSAAIVKELEPVWVCCGWRTPPTAHWRCYIIKLIVLQEFFLITRTSLMRFSEFCFIKRVWRGACYYICDIFNNNRSFMCNGAKTNWTVTLYSIKFHSKV
jgi:hypothetical protein